MRVGVLFSGGKDSNYAMYIASKYYEISVLINIVPKDEDSYLFHTINLDIVDLQSKALNIPLFRYYSNKDELNDLKEALYIAKKEYNIEGIVSGAIRSIYQVSRFQKICKDLNLWLFNPLWLRDEIKYLHEILENRFKVIISGWFSYPLDLDILGAEIDESIINKLKFYKEKYGINPAGEGGEFETTVLYQPMFKKRIVVEDFEKIVGKNYGIYRIKKARLE